MDGYSKFLDLAKNLGATHAKIIKTSTIVTAAWVYWKCKFGCPYLNSSLCCPPNTPTYRETRELLDCFEDAMLIQVIIDPNDEKPVNLTDVVTSIERDLFLNGYYKVFSMGAGCCQYCGDNCSHTECRQPAKARPLIEACGIDVYSTVRNNGLTIDVLHDYSDKITLCGLILIE